LEPIFGAYIWSLYLEPPALARVVPFFGICSKAPNKGTKWCLYLVPSWLGALLSGAFLKIRCSVPAPGQPPATAPPATAPPAPAPPPPAEGSTRPKKKIKLSVTDFKMAKCFIGHKKLVNEVIITYWVRTTALRQIFTHTLWLMSVFNSMHPTTGGCRSKHCSIYFNGTEAR